MRRVLFTLLALAGVIGSAGAACTAFDFPAPEQASQAGGPVGFLDTDDAARLCAQLFQCPRLAQAIALSMALPLDTPASPLGFSSCMDWVAGPVDPERLGLAQQRAMLAAVAQAGSCAAAVAALPVQPAATSSTCSATSCADSTEVAACTPEAGTFVIPCSQSLGLLAQSGACFTGDAGVSVCISTGACLAGSSCSDPATLVECRPDDATFTSYNCSLSGRQCAPLGKAIADCVVPGHSLAPCLATQVRDACDGTSVLHCAGAATAQTEFDCSAVGRTCSTANPPAVARCVGAADTCNPLDTSQNLCSGTQISVCVGGASIAFDCASIGLQCVAASGGATAHCG
jgi:hypothetical protein